MARVPAYFDAFLAAIAEGARIDHVHLGHWDEPERVGPEEARATFPAAQARLSQHLVAELGIAPGHRVLDVGCGFGGTLRAMRRGHPGAELYGLNIDARQLAVGLRAEASPANASWIAADACRLPFADATFDRLLCVEAAFHFPSRLGFLREAHRVLSPGGVLVMSDLLLRQPALPPATLAAFADRLERDYGPWPAMWATDAEIAHDAARAGFSLRTRDATRNTGPSYHVVAPNGRPGLTGGVVLRELHRSNCLSYLYLRLDKR
ncbi:SAM-dependent methyltransferase [Methylobacterium sp. BE186]|uniref:class I SAM-dependent methyltransferase n=1 Tax=Methylobacterium sp. BE186 TaxID=2817715 RepID=UPI002855AAB2|nr:methyltransferase domain-containing protein [Methylobacterium sp. BE186]MDR7038068.1 SAM-dependent methyltransferase [Methylobacterium sp. BE186]